MRSEVTQLVSFLRDERILTSSLTKMFVLEGFFIAVYSLTSAFAVRQMKTDLRAFLLRK